MSEPDQGGRRHRAITRHSSPRGVRIGCEREEDRFDDRLENDPRFLRRVERARKSLRAGKGVPLEDVDRRR